MIVSKLAAGIIAPPAITFYRLVVAVTLMSVFIALPAWRNRKAVKQALPKLFFLGFLRWRFTNPCLGDTAKLLQGGWHVGDMLMLLTVSSYALYSG